MGNIYVVGNTRCSEDQMYCTAVLISNSIRLYCSEKSDQDATGHLILCITHDIRLSIRHFAGQQGQTLSAGDLVGA